MRWHKMEINVAMMIKTHVKSLIYENLCFLHLNVKI